MNDHQGPLLGEPETPSGPGKDRPRGYDYLRFGGLLIVGFIAVGVLVSSLTPSPPTTTVSTWIDPIPVSTLSPAQGEAVSVEWVEPEGPEEVLYVAEVVPWGDDSTIVLLNTVNGLGQVWEVSGRGTDWDLLREFPGRVFDAAVSASRLAVTVENIDQGRVWVLDDDSWYRPELPPTYVVEGNSDGFMVETFERAWSQALLAEALPNPYRRLMFEGLLRSRIDQGSTVLVTAGPYVVDEFSLDELGVEIDRVGFGASTHFSDTGKEWSETTSPGGFNSTVMALQDEGFVTRDNGWSWEDGRWRERASGPIDSMEQYLRSAWNELLVASAPDGIAFYREDIGLGSIDLRWPEFSVEPDGAGEQNRGVWTDVGQPGLAVTTTNARSVIVDIEPLMLDLGEVTASFDRNSVTFTDAVSGEELQHFNHGSRVMDQVRLVGDHFVISDGAGNDLTRIRVEEFVDAVVDTMTYTSQEIVSRSVLLEDSSSIAEVQMPASPPGSVLFVGSNFLLAGSRFEPPGAESGPIWIGSHQN